MKRLSVVAALAAVFVLTSPAVFAQGGTPGPATQLTVSPSPNPVSDMLRQLLPRYTKNMVGAAESMPAEKYNYKPTPEQLTFGHVVLHVAQSNNILCSKLTTTPPPTSDAKDTDAKDKLVATIKASFDYCSEVLAKTTDTDLGTPIALSATRSMSRAGIMITLACDWYDHYAAQAIYLRLNGILPPSAPQAAPPKQ